MVSKTYIYIYTHICNRERERDHMKRIAGGELRRKVLNMKGLGYEGERGKGNMECAYPVAVVWVILCPPWLTMGRMQAPMLIADCSATSCVVVPRYVAGRQVVS